MEYKFIPVFFFYVAFIAGLSRGHVEKTNYIEVVTHCRNTCSRYSKISGAYNLEVIRIFWCLPSGSKCEWSELRDFVCYYNERFQKQFQLIDCLDVTNRNNKQPEVLLKDLSSGIHEYMVIERKKLVWPSNRLALHRNEHYFAKKFKERCQSFFQGSGTYKLEVCSPLSISRKKIDNQITEIVDIIRNNLESINSYCVISNSKPIPWSFSKMDNFEMEIYDNSEGVGVIFIENSVEITPDNFLKEYEEVKYELTRLILSASNKFEFVNCQDCIKILLVENYCEFYIDEELMSKMVSEIQLPENIEQLWFVEPEWINDDEYKISYTQVYGNNI